MAEKGNFKIFDFKSLPIEIEVKNLSFVKELPKVVGRPHKAKFYQIVWISEGKAIFRIDFREIPVQSNEILVISSGQVCEFDTKSDYSGKIILFTGSFFAVTEFDSNFLYTSEILNHTSFNKPVSICPQLVGNLFALLDEELQHPMDDFQPQIAQNFLRIILLEAERQHTTLFSPATHNVGRKFYNKVEQHFKENKNVDFYLNLLGINGKTLSKEMKSLTGNTPKTYIDARTILEAKRLLAYSELSVKEIGYELGFDEPTNFNKFFRRHTAITPVKFRESAKR